MEIGDETKLGVIMGVYVQRVTRYLGKETIAPMPPASKPLRIAPTLMMAATKKDLLCLLISLKRSMLTNVDAKGDGMERLWSGASMAGKVGRIYTTEMGDRSDGVSKARTKQSEAIALTSLSLDRQDSRRLCGYCRSLGPLPFAPGESGVSAATLISALDMDRDTLPCNATMDEETAY